MQSPLSRKTNIILITLFAAVIISATIFFTRKWIYFREQTDYFIKTEIHSRILGLDDLNRGNYDVQLHVNDLVMTFDLPIAYEVKNDTILIGDSLSKKENSGVCEIFRIDSVGNARKVSELTVH